MPPIEPLHIHTPPYPLSFRDYLAYDEGDSDADRHYELLDNSDLIEVRLKKDMDVVNCMGLFVYLRQFHNWRYFRLHVMALEVTPTIVTLPDGTTRAIRHRSRMPDLAVLPDQSAIESCDGYCALSLENTSPLLIAEFVDETNAEDVYIGKKAQYEAREVFEYWCVDRVQRKVTVFSLTDSGYVERSYTGGEYVSSEVFPNICLTAEGFLPLERW
ncbi:MAG: Uma2 family endonuclease [Cyanobacteria bacterium J06649_4]